jgi:nucleosome binding factor SPN SPT16 subunit
VALKSSTGRSGIEIKDEDSLEDSEVELSDEDASSDESDEEASSDDSDEETSSDEAGSEDTAALDEDGATLDWQALRNSETRMLATRIIRLLIMIITPLYITQGFSLEYS